MSDTHSETTKYKELLQQSFLTVKQMRSKLEALEGEKNEPIAVIGVGCRFPGGVTDAASFWELLEEGRDAISTFPTTRWDEQVFAGLQIDEKQSIRWGGFLSREEVEQFDNTFFGITPREANNMDPQQRLVLEVAWEALEHAGLPAEDLAGSQSGVFIGTTSNDYSILGSSDLSFVDAYSASGTSHSVIAGRLSYVLDLRGPSIALDTACSSSLVAVHLACQSLRNRECHLALAGGVNLMLSPISSLSLAKWGMMADDGRCKTFDSRADGFVRGEGCGIVVLKRLADALQAGDSVLAVIHGSAVNQDGRSAGLTAPNLQAQQAAIQQAVIQAGITAEDISYVEAHGTGTPLGDPIEIEALKAVIGHRRENQLPCFLGSVKTNFGHTEAAAGIAGLIKVVLSLQHQRIPAHLHFHRLNPHIFLEDTPFVIPTQTQDWPTSTSSRYAGVSSFGFSGTNAHIVLGQASTPERTLTSKETSKNTSYLLPLSARHPQALETLIQRYACYLEDGPERDAQLHDICYTTSVRRTHHGHRIAVTGTSASEIREALLLARDMLRTSPPQRFRPIFIFSGQGGQWIGMGQELWEQETVFRQALQDCDAVMRSYVSWSLIEELLASDTNSRLTEIDVVQPLLFAIEVGLAQLWRSWGIEPDVVVGHSMGEVAAAHVAGILTLDDACRIICLRSQLLRRIRGQGMMALIELPVEETQKILRGKEQFVSIAISNTPRSTVISGKTEIVQQLVQELQARDIFSRLINVDVASHSPQVDMLVEPLAHVLQGIQPVQGTIRFISTVLNRQIHGAELDASYWVKNLREPVQLWPVLSMLRREGYNGLIEISPHPVLIPTVAEAIQQTETSNTEVLAIGSLRKNQPEKETLFRSLGKLYVQGAQPHWQALYPHGGRCITLPSYPWQHERFWLERRERHTHTAALALAQPAILNTSSAHPLLGQRLHSALTTKLFEVPIHLANIPFLADHRVGDTLILPATAYIEMALAALRETYHDTFFLHGVALTAPLVLTDQSTQNIQILLHPAQEEGNGTWQIFSAEASEATTDDPIWHLHASGQWTKSPTEQETAAKLALKEIQARCQHEWQSTAYYRQLEELGFHYGATFQGIQSIWQAENEALGSIQLPIQVQNSSEPYLAHPALLDACLQVISACLLTKKLEPAGTVYLPMGMEQVRIYGKLPSTLWAHAVIVQQDRTMVTSHLSIYDDTGSLIAEINGLSARQAERNWSDQRTQQEPQDLLYQLTWQRSSPEQSTLRQAQPGNWIILADQSGIGKALMLHLQQHYASSVTLILPQDEQERTEHIEAVRKALQNESISYQGIIHLSSLSSTFTETSNASLEKAQLAACARVLALVKLLATSKEATALRLWVVTYGAQVIEPASHTEHIMLEQAPLWGLGRSIAIEHPEFHCSLLDLESDDPEQGAETITRELRQTDNETQVAYRGGERYTPRLLHHQPASDLLQLPSSGISRLDVTSRGVIDHLVLSPAECRSPEPNEVRIDVHAAGLNFRDVLNVLGTYAGNAGPLGSECAGTIVEIGRGITDLHVGDRVIAFLAPGSFSQSITLPAFHVMPIPEDYSLEVASSLSTAFLTAYYGLHVLANIQPGERVLIHSATGGVGLAALALAKAAGAEIYATAGSEKKRAYLQSQGIQHVFNSRSLDFAHEIRQRTQEQGIDIVLNALTGEYITESLRLLKPGGRFIELGKAEIWERAQLEQTYPEIIYQPLDLGNVFQHHPEHIREALAQIFMLLKEGVISPLPYKVFPIEQAVQAFRYMAQAKHIGKIVLSFEATHHHFSGTLDANGTYLVTGGLGGLGLIMARWLVDHGARHLALLGRHHPSSEAQSILQELEHRGAQIHVFQADITHLEDVQAVFTSRELEATTIRGVIHAAGVLNDGMLLQQDWQSFATVMAPKVWGTWNLHLVTRDLPLDFFLLFSSMASLLGSAGQSNYAAANAFLDTFAAYRRASGLPAISINWGAWSEKGQAASNTISSRMQAHGMHSITPEQGGKLLEQILRDNDVQVGAAAISWSIFAAIFPGGAPPLLAAVRQNARKHAQQEAHIEQNILTQIEAAHPAKRYDLLHEYVRKQINKVLGLSPSRIISNRQGLFEFGMDSLMAVEVRNALSIGLGRPLPTTLLFDYPTIEALIEFLAIHELALTPPSITSAALEEDTEPPTQTLEMLNNLSDEETELLLLEKLGQIYERKNNEE